MISNPIAFLFQPARLLVFVVGILSCVAALSTLDLATYDGEACDASDVSRVELLR